MLRCEAMCLLCLCKSISSRECYTGRTCHIMCDNFRQTCHEALLTACTGYQPSIGSFQSTMCNCHF